MADDRAVRLTVAQEPIKISDVPATREALTQASMWLWGINLRQHRGDDDFRVEVHHLRDQIAALIEAMEHE